MRRYDPATKGVLRVLLIAMLVLTCSGLSSLVSAELHDHDDECVNCGSECPQNCNPRSCPPGPLCNGVPHAAIPDRPLVLQILPVETDRGPFPIDARMPASVLGNDVFHPPRHA